ncbi:MAG: flagellar filament capping protein FliD [Planctomycetaceae bacterium]
MITIDGLVSGIDTQTIVDGLLEIQQQQVDRFTLRRSEILGKQSVFKNLEASLISLRSDVSKLARVQGNPFSKRTVTTSDESVISASGSSSSVPGTYRLTVDSVARAHQIASQGFADTDSEITQGTLEFRVGSGELHTITVDSSNNTLQGLADSFNATDSGVSASVIRDASTPGTPFRLLLTASDTGTENEISISSNLAADSGGAVQPVFDFDNPVQAATNAQVTLGSGAGAITVESADNRVDNLISGVTLDLLNDSGGQEITISVARDTEAAVSAVEDFVNGFNATMKFIADQSQFNADSGEGGPLLGNRSVIGIQQKLRSTLVSVVPGVNSAANRLSAIGISVADNGSLVLNRAELEDAINGKTEGVTSDDIRRLFSLDGTSTNSGIDFLTGSSRTRATTDPIQVDITQAAERATITGGTALAESTVIDDTNRTLEIKVDGTTATITLDQGTYTRQELADHVELLINGSKNLPGRTVRVGLDSDALTITSETYGRTSDLLVSGGTALTALGITAGTADVGRDVAGTFTVNGVTEAARGSGQFLTGDPENETTADLSLRVTLQPSQITAGVEGEVTVTRGLAATLDEVLGDLLDPTDGGLATIDDAFDEQLASLQTALDRQQAIFDRQQQSLISQFVALESSLSQLQSTSQFVTAQLSSLPQISGG